MYIGQLRAGADVGSVLGASAKGHKRKTSMTEEEPPTKGRLTSCPIEKPAGVFVLNRHQSGPLIPELLRRL